jgi:hypothetical protein
MKKLIPFFSMLIVFFEAFAQPQQLYNNNIWFTSTVVPYSVGGGHGLVNGTLNVPQGMFIYGEFDNLIQPPSKPFSYDSLVGGGSAFTKENVVLMTTGNKIIWYNIPIAVYSMCFTPDSSAIWFYGHPDQNGHSICIYDVANNTYTMTGRIADSIDPIADGLGVQQSFISMIDNHTALIGGNMRHFGTDDASDAFLYTDADVVTPLTGADTIRSTVFGMTENNGYTYICIREAPSPVPYPLLVRYNSATRSLDTAFSNSLPPNFQFQKLFVKGNDLYVVGYTPTLDYTIWRCNTTTLAWSVIANPDRLVSSISFDGMYIEFSGQFGYLTNSVSTNGIGTYNPSTGIWSQKYNNYTVGGTEFYMGIDLIDSNLIAVDQIGNIMMTSTSSDGLLQVSDNISMQVYPNPASNIVNIKGASGQIILTDISGKVLIQAMTQTGDLSINTSSFDRGLYFLYNESHVSKITLE